MLTSSQEATFRRLTIGAPATMRSYVGAEEGSTGMIESRCLPLIRLAALVMADPTEPLYQHEVASALAAGASCEEIIGVLLAVAPVAGSARVSSAAPKIAMALGYDVEAALAELDEDAVRPG